jgi:hypothetical protein
MFARSAQTISCTLRFHQRRWRPTMPESFRIDLGNGRQPTAAGWVVIILAVLVTAGVGLTFLQWGPALIGVEDPFLGFGMALALGAVTLAIGWVALRALRTPFSRRSEK